MFYLFFARGGFLGQTETHGDPVLLDIKKKGEFTLQRKNNNSVIPLKMELSLPAFLSLFSVVQGGEKLMPTAQLLETQKPRQGVLVIVQWRDSDLTDVWISLCQ